MEEKIAAIVLAAGEGKRMGSGIPKQYMLIKSRPLVYYALKAFEESTVDEVILVTGEDEIDYCKEYIVDRYHFNKVTKIVPGGWERYGFFIPILCLSDQFRLSHHRLAFLISQSSYHMYACPFSRLGYYLKPVHKRFHKGESHPGTL